MIQLQFSFMSLIFSIIKSDRHNIAEIVLKVTFNTITLTSYLTPESYLQFTVISRNCG